MQIKAIREARPWGLGGPEARNLSLLAVLRRRPSGRGPAAESAGRAGVLNGGDGNLGSHPVKCSELTSEKTRRNCGRVGRLTKSKARAWPEGGPKAQGAQSLTEERSQLSLISSIG